MGDYSSENSFEILKSAKQTADPELWQESDLRRSSAQIQDSHRPLAVCFQVTWKIFPTLALISLNREEIISYTLDAIFKRPI